MTVRIKVVGLGAGGHARVVRDCFEAQGNRIELAGFVDPARSGVLDGYPILGDDAVLPGLRARGVSHFFVGVGSTGGLELRIRLHEAGVAAGLQPLTIIHPAAIVSRTAQLGAGSCVMPGAIVNAGATAGLNCCINTGAIVEHDCALGDHAFVAPGAVLAGAVSIGVAAFVGMGAAIRQGIRVGDRAVVAAGAVVVRDVAPGDTVMGNPAQSRRQET